MKYTTKIITITMTVTALLWISSQVAHAAEITPSSSIYSYGSTSEFSETAVLSVSATSDGSSAPSSTSSSSLAPTGSNYANPALVYFGLIAAGVMIIVMNHKRKVPKKYRLYR